MMRSGMQLARKGITKKPTARLTASRQVFYDVRPQVWTRAQGMCEICGDARAAEYHHRQPRGMGGSSRSTTIHSPAALLAICRADHIRCESERSWAEENGYIVRRGVTDVAEVPVFYRTRWALLSHDGDLLWVAADQPTLLNP